MKGRIRHAPFVLNAKVEYSRWVVGVINEQDPFNWQIITISSSSLFPPGDPSLAVFVIHGLPSSPSSNSFRNDDNGHENAWLEANYLCLSGYELRDSTINRLLCRDGKWMGQVPSCVAATVEPMEMVKVNESMCPSSNGLCDQLCSVNRETGQHECSCFKGFTMQDGMCRGEFTVSSACPY